MNIADEIKQRIKMADVFERYGFQPNRGGFIPCPFHAEKTASLSAYHHDELWKCFGCGAGGDVISFVMQLYSISFSQAVLRMNLDFSLGISSKAPNIREQRALSERRKAEQDATNKSKFYIEVLAEYHRRLWENFLNKRPKSMEEVPCPAFSEALLNLDEIAYRVEEIQKEMR